MGKKSAKLNLIYLAGCALIVLGFCLPMFKVLGQELSGLKFIDFENFNFVTIGALLILIGGIAGVVSCFVPQLKSLQMIFVLASIVGGIVLVLGFTTASGLKGSIYKAIGKGFLKNSTYGLYVLVCGWLVSLFGIFKN